MGPLADSEENRLGILRTPEVRSADLRGLIVCGLRPNLKTA